MKNFCVFLFLFCLTNCAITHYDSLDEKPQTEILISSNIPSELWSGDKKLKDVSKEHLLEQSGMQTLTLKADGMHDSKVIVFRNLPEQKNVSSHESSILWTMKDMSEITSNVAKLGGDAMTTSPTSTLMLPINLVRFAVDLAFLPFDFSTKFNPYGYYFAYDKNQFYVEMVPADASKQELLNAEKLQVKMFVLKNYPELAKKNQEYIFALSEYANISQEDILKALEKVTPAEVAEEIALYVTDAP